MRVKSARSIRKGASSGQTAASLVENHARKPPSSALIANHASKPALFEVPYRICPTRAPNMRVDPEFLRKRELRKQTIATQPTTPNGEDNPCPKSQFNGLQPNLLPMEQGIFKRVSGKILQRTGNFSRRCFDFDF